MTVLASSTYAVLPALMKLANTDPEVEPFENNPLVIVTVNVVGDVKALPSMFRYSIPLILGLVPRLIDVLLGRRMRESFPAPPSIVSVLASSQTVMESFPASATIESAPALALIWSSPSVPVNVSGPSVPVLPKSAPKASLSSMVGELEVPPRFRLPK